VQAFDASYRCAPSPFCHLPLTRHLSSISWESLSLVESSSYTDQIYWLAQSTQCSLQSISDDEGISSAAKRLFATGDDSENNCKMGYAENSSLLHSTNKHEGKMIADEAHPDTDECYYVFGKEIKPESQISTCKY
jgi:hypothetical protein